ncbi:MAG TPA: hypothetical protein VHL98_21975 [Microvirga sp.]|jgi:chromosome segregation ATPase|nr:hypothetical protein [Microvirga sp.]
MSEKDKAKSALEPTVIGTGNEAPHVSGKARADAQANARYKSKEELTRAISFHLKKARNNTWEGLEAQREAGRLLREAKEKKVVKHGEFNQWARDTFNIKHAWRADLMRLDRLWDEFIRAKEYFEAKGQNLNANDFSATGALRLIKDADADRNGAPASKAPRRSKAQDQIGMLQHDKEQLEAKVKELGAKLKEDEQARAHADWQEAEKAGQPHEAKQPMSEKDAELDRTRKELEQTRLELRMAQEQISVLKLLMRPKTDTSLGALLRRIQISGEAEISPWVPPDVLGSYRRPREPKTGFKRHLVPPNLLHLKGLHPTSPLRHFHGRQH